MDTLSMKLAAAKIVSNLLNFEQKKKRSVDIAQEMMMMCNDNLDLLKRVIAGDESWVYGYDTETKAQSSQWKRPEEPGPKKARQVRSNEDLATVFFYCNSVVHHEFNSSETHKIVEKSIMNFAP